MEPLFRTRWRLLAFGFVLAFFSSFGQTSFIAVFGPVLRHEFGLSNGALGGMYSVATLASGLLLAKIGGLIDAFPMRSYASVVVAGLGLAALTMASAPHLGILLLAFFLLRLFGQGLMTHVAITAMAREFNRSRGRAVAVATSGIPLGEAMFPAAAVLAIAIFGWREAWLLAGAICFAIVLPLSVLLLRPGASTPSVRGSLSFSAFAFLTRREMLLALPSFMASGFIITAVVFHQGMISDEKDWPEALFPSFFFAFGVAAVGSTFVWGWLVDRVGAWRLGPLFLLPLALGCMALALSDGRWVAPAFLASAGATFAGYFPILTALIADRYGTEHLGAMRATTASLLTISTSLSPALIGVLLDAGVSTEALAASFAALAGWSALMLKISGLSGPPTGVPTIGKSLRNEHLQTGD